MSTPAGPSAVARVPSAAASVLVIARRDLRSAFETPLAYIVLAAFTTVAGLLFAHLLFGFSDLSSALREAAADQPGALRGASMDLAVVAPLVASVSFLLVGLVPLVTMRALAEEKRNGTLELLLTAPLGSASLVIGKFLGALGLSAAAIALTSLFPLVLIAVGTPDPGPLLTGYAGLLLVAATFTALGLLASSLTDSTVVAAFLGFAFIAATVLMGVAGSAMDTNLGTVIAWPSPLVHFGQLAAGLVSTADIAYFVLFTSAVLFLTLRVVDSRRWR